MRKLRLLTMALGAVIIAVGLIGVAAPSLLLEFGRSLQTPNALYAIAAVRVAFGGLLFWAAPVSRMPTALRILGTFIVVAGLLTPLFGVERTQAMITWWSAQGPLVMRGSACLAVAFGSFVIYVLYPRRRPAA